MLPPEVNEELEQLDLTENGYLTYVLNKVIECPFFFLWGVFMGDVLRRDAWLHVGFVGFCRFINRRRRMTRRRLGATWYVIFTHAIPAEN